MQSTKSNEITVFPTTKLRFYMRVFILFCYSLVRNFLHYFKLLTPPHPPITVSSQSDTYIALRTTMFLESYTKYSNETMNENIEKCFYDAKSYNLTISDAENDLEKTWKRRILFETTPRGNIIMHYDAYKQGFVYYSDNSNIPYFVINAAIMKYVIMYRCRDFFIDNQIVPAENLSPLLIAPEKSTNQTTDRSSIRSDNTFAKLKNYNSTSSKLQTQKDTHCNKRTPHDTTEKHYTRNKIIYSGKLSNMSFLQPYKHTSSIPTIRPSPILDDLNSNANAQTYVFNYRDFKRMKEQTSASN